MASTSQPPSRGDIVLDQLMNRHKQWAEGKNRIDLEDEAERAPVFIDGQNPDIVVITCSDSRVIPEYIMQAKLGELFVIRIAGNVMSEEVLASVEFAVTELDAVLVIVLGHQQCGAVQAKLQQNDKSPSSDTESANMRQLLNKIALPPGHEGEWLESVKFNAKYQADQLIQSSDILAKMVENDKIEVRAAIYQLENRQIEILGSS